LLFGSLQSRAVGFWKPYQDEFSPSMRTLFRQSRRMRCARRAVLFAAVGIVVFWAGSFALNAFQNCQRIQMAASHYSHFSDTNHHFSIDQTEVSYGQYRLCVQSNACQQPSENQNAPPETRFQSAPDDFPVAWVTAFQAEAYCHWQGRRLPTEHEWQVASEITPAQPFPWGTAPADNSRIDALIDGLTPLAGTPKPVGVQDAAFETGRTALGHLWNMVGNVQEWTTTTEAKDAANWDGISDTRLRVKGGSYLGPMIDPSGRVGGQSLADYVLPVMSNKGDQDIGFRCAANDAP
jgi:formylglycine-generating enzyme required for sulfatase activity